MDLVTIGVSHLREDQRFPGVQVEVIGPHQGIDEIAESAGTIGYEILTNLGARFARTYLNQE